MTSELKIVKTAKFAVIGLTSERDAPTTSAATESKGQPSSKKKQKTEQQQQKQQSKSNDKNKIEKKKSSKEQQQSKQKKEVVERPWTDELEQDYQRILSVGEECVSPAELKSLLLAKGHGSNNDRFRLYDGFEPSGRMHIAQGIFKAVNVNKCTASHGTFVFWVADWFALMNDKMGGDLEKIRIVGQYLQHVWKAAGMQLQHVVFKWASDEITQQAHVYWPLVLDVARRFNMTRIKKCCQIMGRLEGSLTAAQILYPLMQCTDVFFLKADICQLGVDQRKVNMLAREYCDFSKMKRKPVILSHHMLYGLKAGQEKMSKSDADSAIFMEDSPQDVERKIMQAYCPSKEEETTITTPPPKVEDAGKESMHLKEDTLKNPCLDYVENIIFAPDNAVFVAGQTKFTDAASVRAAFVGGSLSEKDLKQGLIEALNALLEPVRQHFATNEEAKTLLEQVQQFKRQAAATSKKPTIRRLDLVQQGMVKPKSFLVFAPLPSAAPTLQEATNILAQLKTATKDDQLVLYLSDWTARVCNACDADTKAVSAYYSILLASLRALDGPLMERVTIILQSQAILADPSNYWISVINVGRHFALSQVMGPNMKDSDGVGPVIGRLLRVADVVGVLPARVALVDEVEVNLVTQFFAEKLDALPVPDIIQEIPLFVNIALQQRDSNAHRMDNDEYFLLDDPKVNGKSKMKKAFCKPGNLQFCPPIALATAFLFHEGKDLVIKRSPDNGGDVTYTTQVDLENDFKSGALHPGDLKATLSTLMVQVLEKISNGIKGDGDAAKAAKTLKAFVKKMGKKGKK